MALGRLSFARLRPVHVAALSVAYWIGLAAVKLGGLLVAVARVALPGMHGNVGAELKNLWMLHLTVSSAGGSVLWEGSTSLAALVAWIAGPPLIVALTARWAREIDTGEELGAAAPLGGGAEGALDEPRGEWNRGADRLPVEVERDRGIPGTSDESP